MKLEGWEDVEKYEVSPDWLVINKPGKWNTEGKELSSTDQNALRKESIEITQLEVDGKIYVDSYTVVGAQPTARKKLMAALKKYNPEAYKVHAEIMSWHNKEDDDD